MDMLGFSLAADIFCLILCAIGIIGICLWREALGKSRDLLVWVFTAHAIHIQANLLGLLFKGKTAWYVHGLLRFTNFAEFEAGYILAFLLSLYIISIMERDRDLDGWKWVAKGIAALATILLIVSQFTGMYYTIDPQNYYHRGELYPLSLAFGIAVVLLDLALLLRHYRRLEMAERIAIGVYLVLPTAAMIVQPLIYGVYILLLADTVAMTVMFLIMLFVQTRAYYEKEQQLSEMRLSIALSQIQPHFLYNSLNSIYHLCGKDPKAAQRAVAEFSDYLRGNLDSLNRKAVVPFATELQHVGHYLALETMRYEELLRVDLSGVEADGFLIPFMTVQPLVENAVQHGLGHKPGGGTVWLSSREREDSWEVTIRDDGVGFAPGGPPEDGKSHVGIENVRQRLWAQSRGTLEIVSTPGQGTTATICVPKSVQGL